MKKKNAFEIFLSILVCIGAGTSCTKLDTKVYDRVTNFWKTDDQIAAGVAPAYSDLRNLASPWQPNVYNLNEMSTDEIIVPNRVIDWADGVTWEQMWKHTWGANHEFVVNAWQFIYGGISRVNGILEAVSAIKPRPTQYNMIEAELKTIRAFYHFLALDLYGNVPIQDSNYLDQSKLATRPRVEVFSFVEKEIKNNLLLLPTDVNPRTYGRATQWFAQSLLAKLYLNADVYTGTPRWRDCIAACEAVLHSNNYSLEHEFFDNFRINNENSKENIFSLPFDRVVGLDVFAIQLCTLHYYSQLTFGLEGFCANGFCSTADYYNFFDKNDKRRKMFLVGQQWVNQDSSKPENIQYDRLGYLLNFNPTIKHFKIEDSTKETAGARCAKWEFNKQGWGDMSNDFGVFRLADIILMKAEAQFRMSNVTDAVATINQKINGVSIRNRVGMPDFTLAEMTPDGLLRERACELSWEGWRRNDMVRLGHFTDARTPDKLASADYRKLYPIPQLEIDKNPYLKQNPGY